MESRFHSETLDPEICRRARLSRDPRFDGEFYLGVTTTGIYCRPVCPARLPAEQNVRYFRHAAQAAEAGFRPCLRCRPETAPDSPARAGSRTTVNRALSLIRGGALNGGSLGELAGRLGVGERYLRKLFQRELGLSPQAIAHHHRLLMARQLIVETDLPLVDVAHAAGFGSVRRFNSAIRQAYGVPASAMRRRKTAGSRRDRVRIELRYRPPYDWDGVIGFFRRHAVAGVETVCDTRYARYVSTGAGSTAPALLEVRPVARRDALELTLSLPDTTHLMPVIAAVRRMFDLDANPAVIGDSLSADPLLGPLIRANPGVRSPGYWSAAEAAVRAIVGQQVSTAAARNICGRFAGACARDPESPVFPPPAQIAALGDEHFPMPGRRRDTLRALGRAGPDGPFLAAGELAALPGVGPWTTAMVAMRGLGDPDAFPTSDLGLVKAWEALGGERKALATAQKHWSPWRSYAANLLWRSLPT